MELDDLKGTWQKEAACVQQLNAKKQHYLEALLNGKTVDVITLMKKRFEKMISSLLYGMLLLVLVFPLLSDGFTFPGSMNGFAKAMFFYLVVILFYWEKLKSVSHFQLSDHLKERMEQLLKMLRTNLKIEVVFALFFFLALILVGRFFYGKGLQDLDDRGFLIATPLFLILAGVFIWLIIKRAKKQISELEIYLAEYDQNCLKTD
ncbi:MAG: hypothetical protein ACOH2A_06090 [Sphingobacteriaceae bacterium]